MKHQPVPGDPPAEPTNRGRDETRARILQVALELFARDGFDDTTVREIAARCGLTDAAIFYYFPSKRHVLDALWRIPSGSNIRALAPSGVMTEERVRELTDETLDFIADNHEVMRLMTSEALAGDRTASALQQESRAVWRRTIHAHFTAAFDEDIADSATDALHSLIHGFTMRAMMEHGERMGEVCRDPEFRDQLFQRARLVVPLSPLEPAS
ncbi:MAG: TetR/AcrR family transcriptional regulator [Dehalococcoidia bacterium]|nr:TetR/AcrR family transcriptional regulator [Dehalococcoidia bacterium]